MGWKIVGGLIGFVAIATAAFLIVSKARLDRDNARRVEALVAKAKPPTDAVFTEADLDGLPAPVRRYFRHVLTEGQPYVTTVRLVQRGDFRLGDVSAPWRPLEATQHFTVNPPGFIWLARIQMAPLLNARVIDAYTDGTGLLRAHVLSAIPVADATPAPELDEGELMRYLAEGAWFPTALLPASGVTWTAVDDRSARATRTDRGHTVSVTVHFSDQDEIERVVGHRYRDVDGRYELTSWTGHFSNYQVRDGMRIPIDGEVAWNLPEGDLPYWRASIVEIAYDHAQP